MPSSRVRCWTICHSLTCASDSGWVTVVVNYTPPSGVQFIGSTATWETSTAVPPHEEGDLLVAFASGNSIPSLPAGWTSLTTNGDYPSRVAYRLAPSSGTASGTWTGATGLTILVYRGATAGAAAIHYSTESGPQTLPALNLSGTPSWVAGIGHWLTSLDPSPSGLTQRHAYEWGGLWVAAWDTGGDVTSWSATQVGPTAAAWSWLAASIQLIPVATDSAAAVDAESVAATLTASDTATASDSSSGITAAAASTDTATGADAAAVVVTFRAVSSSDAATAVESAAVASESQERPAPRSLDETLAGSARITTTVVFLAGPAAGQSLPVIDGEVTVDDTSRVRRTCRLTVLASSEWVPTTVTHPLSLAQVSEWQIVQHLTLDDGTEMSWSQGVYHLTSPAVAHDSAGAFTITLEGADRAARAKLVGMQARWVGAAGGLVVPAVEAMLAAYCPWLPLGLTDLGHRLGGTQDMVLGEYGADLWDTAAQILTSVAGYSLHVDRDGVAVSPLILDPLADRVVAAWATGEGGMLGSLELGADITSIINEVGVPWEEPRPEGADSTWVPASGVEVAVDASSDYGTLSPVGPRRHRFQGDTSVIGSAGQAAQVATSTLVRMQGLSMTSRARVLIDPRRDAGDVVSVTDPVLGLDGALLRISGLTIPLRPDAVWMDVRFGTRRL